MGGVSSSAETYLHDIEAIGTETPDDLLKVRVTGSFKLNGDGDPCLVFNPAFRDGERRSNPFLEMKTKLVEENKFIAVTKIHLVEYYNDLDIPVTVEIRRLFSNDPTCKFSSFPVDRILNLGGEAEDTTTNDTGRFSVKIPARASEIITSGIELYRSTVSQRMLMDYAASDDLIKMRQAIVFRKEHERQRPESGKTVPKGKQEENDDEKGDDDNNNNNDEGEDVPDLDDPLATSDRVPVNAPSVDLPYTVYQRDHIFMKAFNQFAPKLGHNINSCRKLENGCWEVPKAAEKDVVDFMEMTFFRDRRYTMFNDTYMVHMWTGDEREHVQELLKEPEWKHWDPQVSFTLWVTYVIVSNEHSATHLHVIKLS